MGNLEAAFISLFEINMPLRAGERMLIDEKEMLP